MKPLELTVYPMVNCGGPCNCDSYVMPDGDVIGVEAVPADRKRFTDAELAAEYWKAAEAATFVTARGGKPIRTGKRLATIHRFATLPHASENDYE